jgi:hypothetical protein
VRAQALRSPKIVSFGKPAASLAANRWRFVLSADPAAAEDRRALAPVSTASLVARVRGALARQGALGVAGFARVLRLLDDRRSGRLDRSHVKWGLLDRGVDLSEEEFDLLLDALDRERDGLVRYSALLDALCQHVPASLDAKIDALYDRLSPSASPSSSSLTLDALAKALDAKALPRPPAGAASDADVLALWLSQWDAADERAALVSRADFLAFFRRVAATYASADAFADDLDRFFP